ncbi:MAG TPA: hypothetical protein VEH79_04840 [Gaiellaceae bacterium]|nr:hypothetical protein [Gaiellaceae bacterium]
MDRPATLSPGAGASARTGPLFASLARVSARSTPSRVLAGMVALSVVVRSLLGFARATPTYFPDEYMYSALSRSIAESGRPLVRGGNAHFTALLEPLVTAPFWLIHDTWLAYHLIQVFSVAVMSLVAVPIYGICAALGLRKGPALLAAALVLCGPAFMYATWIVSEPFAYPLAAAAVVAGASALGSGSRRWQVAFVVLCGLAGFARLQLLILPLAYLAAAAVVAWRMSSFRQVVREQRVVLGTLALPILLMVPLHGRVLGVYGHFGSLELGGVPGVAHRFAVNALILLYGAGWIVVPGALIGIAVCLARPRSKTELAYGAMALSFGLGVLVQASIWGDLDRPQERYFLYAVPLLAPLFALTVERGWPWARANALLATAMIALAAAVPLSGYATSVVKTQSPSLFGVYRIEELLGTASGALAVSLVAAGLSVVALVLPRLRRGTALATGIGLACVASLTLAAAAADFDLNDSKSVGAWALASDPSWVDDAGIKDATLVRAQASWGDVHLQMFWNRSIRRIALMPDATPVDGYPHEHLSIGNDGTLLERGRPLSGPIVADEWGTPMLFRDARVVSSSPFDSLVLPTGRAQLELYAPGFFRDGLMSRSGSIHLWPAQAGGSLAGTLSFRLRAPRWLPEPVTIRFVRDGGAPLSVAVPAGASRSVRLTVCSTGAWSAGFLANRSTFYDHRSIAIGSSAPIWHPDPSACTSL